MSGDDELERIAKRGRALRERDRASVSTTADEAAQHERRTIVAVSAFARWVWVALAIGAGAGVFTLAVYVVPDAFHGETVADVVSVVACGASFAFFYLLRFPIGRRALAHERAWTAALPFAVVGYPDALGTSTTEGRWVVEVRFRGPADATETAAPTFRERALTRGPELDDVLLADALRTIGATVSDGAARGERRIETKFELEESSVLTNAHMRAFMRRLLPTLVAIHARYPIAEARVLGFRS